MTGSELVASEIKVPAVEDSAAEEDGITLSGFPEFEMSGDGFCGDASLELEAEEVTDIEVAGTAAALRRAASWSPVTQTGVPSDLVA
jgi:hypothetical protein